MTVLPWEEFVDGALKTAEPYAVTVGVFDGVHRGHQHLLSKTARFGPVCVITFIRNPQELLDPDGFMGNICTIEQKLELLEKYGAGCVVMVDFDAEFRSMRGAAFLDSIIESIDTPALVIGSDFRCGVNLDTGVEEIVRHMSLRGCRVDIACPVQDNGQSVSSTRIRYTLRDGCVRGARRLLGHPYVLDLRNVAQADGRIARTEVAQVLPDHGSYVVRPDGSSRAVDMTVFPDYIEIRRAGRCDLIEFLNRKPTPVA